MPVGAKAVSIVRAEVAIAKIDSHLRRIETIRQAPYVAEEMGGIIQTRIIGVMREMPKEALSEIRAVTDIEPGIPIALGYGLELTLCGNLAEDEKLIALYYKNLGVFKFKDGASYPAIPVHLVGDPGSGRERVAHITEITLDEYARYGEGILGTIKIELEGFLRRRAQEQGGGGE